MRLIDMIRNAMRAYKSVDLNEPELMNWLGIKGTKKNVLSEVTYFTCLRLLAETLAKMPLKYYHETDRGRIQMNDYRARLLTERPNPHMSATTFWSAVENNRNHYGNAYVWIRGRWKYKGRYVDGYEILDLWILPSNCTSVLMDDIGIFGNKGSIHYEYSDPNSGKTYYFHEDEVMHFKTSVSFDGIMGRSIRDILADSLDGSLESQNFMNNLYRQGLSASMALQYTGDFDEKRLKELQRKYTDHLMGAQNAGKIVTVPLGLQLTPLNAKLTDAQFFDLKKYSALQIAAAFGIKPDQINHYEKSSYRNSEMQQLTFLVDTMLYVLEHYEEEINYKMLLSSERNDGYFFKYNEKALLRTDSETQMKNLASAVNNGIYTPNEARSYLNMPTLEGGDRLMINGNYIPVTDVGKQYNKGGENNE